MDRDKILDDLEKLQDDVWEHGFAGSNERELWLRESIADYIVKNCSIQMDMKAENIRIGMNLIHREKGEITVLGITPHCGDYCITIDEGWVYLKNCTGI
jgi:hypothetical protein